MIKPVSEWLARRKFIHRYEMGAKYYDLYAAEEDLMVKNYRGLAVMARKDIKDDADEIQQAEADLKTLHEAKTELQSQLAILTEQHTKDSDLETKIASINIEIGRCERNRAFYKAETKKREEEIKTLELDLKKAGHVEKAANYRNVAIKFRRIADELRKT